MQSGQRTKPVPVANVRRSRSPTQRRRSLKTALSVIIRSLEMQDLVIATWAEVAPSISRKTGPGCQKTQLVKDRWFAQYTSRAYDTEIPYSSLTYMSVVSLALSNRALVASLLQ